MHRPWILGFSLTAVAACGAVDPMQPDAAVEPDAALEPDAETLVDALPFVPEFGTAELITELSLDGAHDEDPTITADELELIFISNRPGSAGSGDLWSSKRASKTAAWGAPTVLGELSSAADE